MEAGRQGGREQGGRKVPKGRMKIAPGFSPGNKERNSI
jgi:hypothetical protein